MSVAITLNSPNCADVAEHLRRMVPNYIKPAQMAVMQAVAMDIVEEMRESGKKPTHPIQWDSEKQRRAFFATDGFGGGIPTKRSGAYQEGWQYSLMDDKAKVSNDDPSTKFVGGNAFGLVSSGIHVDDWKNFGRAIALKLQQLPAMQKQALNNAVQEFLSKRG